MLSHLSKYQIILASQSPRRQQLLGEIVEEFECIVKPVDEVYSSDLKREEIAIYLSQIKSEGFGALQDKQLVITADTIVCLGDRVLEKPKSKEQAIEMLTTLCGKTHTVYTGVTVRDLNHKVSFYDATDVTFKLMEQAEIEFYIDKCKPFDKAGSYGIQEWWGYVAIEKMEGEFYNVMGLPLHKLFQVLKTWN